VIIGLFVAVGLEIVLGSGGAAMGMALSVVVGGVIRHWQERVAFSCRVNGPRLHPLQVSAFGVMALGVQWYYGLGGGAVATLSMYWPVLGSSWLPLLLVGAGVGWLGVLSVKSSCRDEQLLAMMGEHYR
jgi:hypothetical protein